MRMQTEKKNVSLSAVAVIYAVTAFLFSAAAQDPEQKLFNQLYREIVSASDVKITVGDTSFGPTVSGEQKIERSRQSAAPGADGATERLQLEINKMMQDVKLRHDAAVRFMQDK